MKKLLVLMMSAILMTSFAGCAGNSAKPAEETTDTKQMPSKFDLRQPLKIHFYLYNFRFNAKIE